MVGDLADTVSNITENQDVQSLAGTAAAETIAANPTTIAPATEAPPTEAFIEPTEAMQENTAEPTQSKPTRIPTRDTSAQATEQAQSMADYVASLQDRGYVRRTDGSYYAIEDFEDSLAKINYFQRTRTDYSPTNFVIRSHMAWESASENANWEYSGCGFIFHENEEKGEYYMVQLGLDGYVWAGAEVSGTSKWAQTQQHITLDRSEGSADLTLVVYGANVTVLVDEQEVFKTQSNLLTSRIPSGALSFMLNSGTNAGFGTRCSWTQVELWDIGE